VFKKFTTTKLRIILLAHQNNYVRYLNILFKCLSNTVKKSDILATNLIVLHNYLNVQNYLQIYIYSYSEIFQQNRSFHVHEYLFENYGHFIKLYFQSRKSPRNIQCY